MAWDGLHGSVGGQSSQTVREVTREKEIHAQDTNKDRCQGRIEVG